MYSKMFSKMPRLLPHVRRVQYVAVEKNRKGCTSTLYVTGDKSSETFAVLRPHIDLQQRYQDMDALIKNVSDRRLNINVKALKEMWDALQIVEKKKKDLDMKRQKVVEKVKSLIECKNEGSMAELKEEGRVIREEMKVVTREVWDLEKKAIVGGLSLPNVIHADTPVANEEKIVYEFGSKPLGKQQQTHLQIAEKLDLVEYYDSSFYFLKNDAATFELSVSYHLLDKFRDNGFLQMSNSDFGRSITVEGVGIDPNDSSSVFVMEREEGDLIDRLHLVGGASLVSFCSYHAKTVTTVPNLPLRYVTLGRHYSPSNKKGLYGLFSTWQSSAVEAFVTAANHEQAMGEFQAILDLLVSIYSSLGFHFRVVYLPACSLRPWESLRASLQMFSSNLQKYIEVGNVSLCDDYISKRLLMCCTKSQNSPQEFLHIVSATLISVPHMLGCILEYNAENFSLPKTLSSGLHPLG